MKVTKKDIIGIKAGSSMTFHMNSFEEMKSTQTYAYQLAYSTGKPKDVKRYKTSMNIEEKTLTIEAVRK